MTLLAAALVAAGTWMWLPRGVDPRVSALFPPSVENALEPRRRRVPSTPAIAAAVAAVGAFVLLGGITGLAAAAACIVVVPRAVRLLEPRSGRERRTRLKAQAPLIADLLAATMSAGSPMRSALGAVCEAIGDPGRSTLEPVVAALDLGADAALAWSPLVHDESLGAIASAIVRSANSGAPLASVLTRIGEDLRREHQVSVHVAARAAGVRAVLPLALCFLPAFLLLGVVPVVASLAGGLFS